MAVLKINDKKLDKIVRPLMPNIYLYSMTEKMYEAVYHKKDAYFVYDKEFGTYKVVALGENEKLRKKYISIYMMSYKQGIPGKVLSDIKNNNYSPTISKTASDIYDATFDYWNKRIFDMYSPDVNEDKDIDLKRYLF
jgi:hypothetical protein